MTAVESEDAFIPVAEAARRKNCTRVTVHNAVKRGDLRFRRYGRDVSIRADETFEKWQPKETWNRRK